MGTGTKGASAAAAIQARIDAVEQAATIEYGIRAVEAMGGWRGCTAEFAGAGWAIEQFEAGIVEAGIVLGDDDIAAGDKADWTMKRARKIARENVKAATEAAKAIGTARQLRIAMAA